MEHDPRRFYALACPTCGDETFVATVTLQHKPGAGLVPVSKGYMCVGCHGVVDVVKALNAYMLKQKREELRGLEAELGLHAGVVPGDENA